MKHFLHSSSITFQGFPIQQEISLHTTSTTLQFIKECSRFSGSIPQKTHFKLSGAKTIPLTKSKSLKGSLFTKNLHPKALILNGTSNFQINDSTSLNFSKAQ